jgi:NADPH:quinone reductase-like Zn-dependent oxidoreductase
MHGGSFRVGHGAFSQFVRVDGENLFRIPDYLSFDEAACYSVAFQTATLSLYHTLQLPEPYGTADKGGTPILIWGGASKCHL